MNDVEIILPEVFGRSKIACVIEGTVTFKLDFGRLNAVVQIIDAGDLARNQVRALQAAKRMILRIKLAQGEEMTGRGLEMHPGRDL
jgi:hypothetical protein